MKRTLIGLCAVVALTLLLTGCGGGGGGVTPPSPTDVARLFPLTQGTERVSDTSETEHTYVKMTGVIRTGLSRKELKVGPFSLPIITLKKLLPKRDGTHTYEQTTDVTTNGTDTSTIIGTHTGDPFPQGVTTTIEETDFQGTTKMSSVEKVDGQIVNQETNQWDEQMWDRSFYTNENGDVYLWGEQHKEDTDWGEIEAYNPPWLLFKAGATSWKVAHIEEDVEDAVFSGDLMGTLVGQETITVPAGTFTCYKVTYKLTNVKLETPPSGVQVTNYSLSMNITIWLALDKGIVKSTESTSLSATFKDLETGATGSISMTSTSTSQLKSFTIVD